MATEPWRAQTQLAEVLGGSKKRSKSKKSGVISQSDWKSQLGGSSGGEGAGGVDGLSPIARRAVAGEMGAERARRAFNALMKSDLSDSTKKEVRKLYEGKGEGPKDKGILARLTDNALVNAVGTGLRVIDTPKRIIAAGLDEAVEQYDGAEDGSSFMDNAFRKDSYGFGEGFQRALDAETAKGGDNKVFGVDLDNPSIKRAVGLTLDVGLDPLTYATAGAVTAAKGAGKAAKGVEAGAGVAEVAAKGGAKLQAKSIARRLAEAGEAEAAKAVQQKGISAVSAEVLDKVGVKGGVRFAGRDVVGHDTVRKLTKVLGEAKAIGGDSELMRQAQRVLGDDALKELRVIARDRSATPEAVVKALGHIDSKRAARLAQQRLGGVLARDMEKVLAAAKKQGVDGETLRAAVAGDEAAAKVVGPLLTERVRGLMGKVRTEANKLGADEWITDAGEDYMPRFITDDARKVVERRTPKGGGARSFERRAAKAGDEFGDQILGSDELQAAFSPGMTPGSRAAVEAQMEGLIRQWSGSADLQVFSRDAYQDLPRYLKGVTKRAGQMAEAKELAKRGVAERIPLGVEDAVSRLQQQLQRPQGIVEQFDAAAPERAAAIATKADEVTTLEQRLAEAVGQADTTDQAMDTVKARMDVVDQADELDPEMDDLVATLRDQIAKSTQERAQVKKLGTKADRGRESLARLRQVDLEGPPKVVQARRQISELQPKFDSYRDALRMAEEPSPEMVTQVGRRIEELDSLLADPSLTDARRAALESARESRSRSLATVERLVSEQDTQARRYLALAAQADELEAQLAEGAVQAVGMDAFLGELRNPSQAKRLVGDQLRGAFQSMAGYGLPEYRLSPYHYEALDKVVEVADDPSILVRYLDKTNRFFKTYALLTPGFHVRNTMGATFNNMVAGVTIDSYTEVGRNLGRWSKGGMDSVAPGRFREFLGELEKSGGILWDDAQVASELGEFGTSNKFLVDKLGSNKITRNVGVTENIATSTSRRIGSVVERYQRTVLAWDTFKKGGTLDDALDKVAQFHFDYSDLSSFETGKLKRVIPFWTWTSRNFPLQMEMVLREPKRYQQFNAIKNNLGDKEDPDLTPSWMKDSPTAINLGGGSYLSPDLPFQKSDELSSGLAKEGPFSLLQSVAPVFKTPLELKFGKQAWNGIPLSEKRTAMPKAWTVVPGLVPALRGLGVINGDKDPETGDYLISGRQAYVIEQALPMLGRSRRLAPSEAKYQERRLSSVLSFMGVGYRTVTEADKQSEVWKVTDKLEALVARGREAGKVE